LGLTLLTLIIIAEFERLIGVPLRGYAGMLMLLLASLGVGWFLGGPARGTRIALALATSARNVGVVMVIAASSFAGTPAVTAAVVFAVFQTIVLVLIAMVWGRLVSA
jgi:BASS family bile acid:Na+ symporter